MTDFVVISRGQCFLCLDLIQAPFVPRDLSSEQCSNSIYSLQTLSRHLKLNMRTVFQGKLMKTELLDKVEKAKLKAELCVGCGQLTRQFSDAYRQLMKAEVGVTTQLELINRKLVKSEERMKSDKADGRKNGGLEGGIKQVMDVLRANLIKKSSRRLKFTTPRVRIGISKQEKLRRKLNSLLNSKQANKAIVPFYKIKGGDPSPFTCLDSDPPVKVAKIELAASDSKSDSEIRIPVINKIEMENTVVGVDATTIPDLGADSKPNETDNLTECNICHLSVGKGNLSTHLLESHFEPQTDKENVYNLKSPDIPVAKGAEPLNDKDHVHVPTQDDVHPMEVDDNPMGPPLGVPMEVESVPKEPVTVVGMETEDTIEVESLVPTPSEPTSEESSSSTTSSLFQPQPSIIPAVTPKPVEDVRNESTHPPGTKSTAVIVVSPYPGNEPWSRHKVTRRYSCNICSRQFAKLDQFWGHYNKDHVTTTYKCTGCEAEYPSQDECNQHHDTVHVPVPAPEPVRKLPKVPTENCKICKKPFARNFIRIEGKNVCQCASKAIPHKYICSCRYCRREFTRIGDLKVHIGKFHPQYYSKPKPTTDRDFKCSVCLENFANSMSLSQHRKISNCRGGGVQNYICSCRYCKKGFTRVYDFKHHLSAVHFPKWKHECNICGKKFSVVRQLRNHEDKEHSKND